MSVEKGQFVGSKNPFFGKKHTQETRLKLSLWHKNNQQGENHPRWIDGRSKIKKVISHRIITLKKCKWCNDEAKRKYKKDGSFGGYNTTCGKIECVGASWHDPEVIKKKIRFGENHPLWKKDRTSLSFRPHHEGYSWKRKVFERDDYTCQMCGERGGKLQADHILPYSKFPKSRWLLANGRTLCIECHKLTPTYGWKMKNLVFG